MENEPSEPTESGSAIKLGMVAADFYAGVLSRFGDTPEGHAIAGQLTSYFIDGLCQLVELKEDGDDDEG